MPGGSSFSGGSWGSENGSASYVSRTVRWDPVVDSQKFLASLKFLGDRTVGHSK